MSTGLSSFPFFIFPFLFFVNMSFSFSLSSLSVSLPFTRCLFIIAVLSRRRHMGEPSRSRAQQDDLRAFLRHPGSPYSRQRSHERTAFLLTASTTPEGQKGQQKRNTHTLSQVTSKQERKKEGEKTKKAEREGRKDRSGKGGEARKVSQERERERERLCLERIRV